jgi:Flp pilus assembly pilin Flp
MTTIVMNYLSITMNYFNNKIKTKWPVRYLGGEEGIVIIEYVLIGALIAVALIGAFQLLEGEIDAILGRIRTALSTAGT